MAYQSNYTGDEVVELLETIPKLEKELNEKADKENLDNLEKEVDNKQNVLISGTSIKTINGKNLLGSGDIVIEGGETLTESDIAAMGFTKNTGTYSKPSGGIPSSDLDNMTQTVLEMANQDHQIIEDINSDVANLYYVKQDKLVSGTNIKTINGQSVLGRGAITISDIYITDFTVNDIEALVGGYYDGPYIATQIRNLYNALETHKLVRVPYDFDKGYRGYCVAYGYSEDLLYLTINLPHGAGFDLELDYNIDEIHSDQIIVRQWGDKQNKLISGTNIKTFNGASILGSGNVTIPTKTSQLENNSNFIDKQSADESYIKSDTFESSTYAKANGVADSQRAYAIPTSANGDEDDVLLSRNTVKTINGESIYGSGNISISGGSASGGSGAYAEVNHGTSDTTFALTPNTFHVWDVVSALTLTLGEEESGYANEFLFQFTSGSTPTTLTLPSNLKWTNDNVPTIAENKTYQISILRGLASVLEFSNN